MNPTTLNPNLALGISEFVQKTSQFTQIQNDTIEAANAYLSQIQSQQSFADDIERNDYDIPINDEYVIPVRITRRIDQNGNLPFIFYIHGGGWILGNPMIYDHLLRQLTKGSYASVVFVDYTKAPFVKYPVQLKELWEILNHLLAHPDTYRLTQSKMILCGDGVGANMATVLTNYAHKQGVNVDYQLLLYPSLDANLNLPSYQQFENGPWLSRATMQWFWDNYLPNINVKNQEMVSPLLIPDVELKGLPDTLIITAENDITRDDGETYARKLTNAGVNAVSVRFNGTIHDFLMLEPLAHTLPTKSAFKLITASLREVLWGSDCFYNTTESDI